MRHGTELTNYVGLIRIGARAVAGLPLGGGALVEACGLVERAGMPSRCRLLATAREYTFFQNSEQLAVTLAGRVGNPRVSPAPPLWPLLALLLLGWRDRLSTERVMERAAWLGMETEVERGLAIVAYLFPELQEWTADIPFRMPLWERTLAVPLAARKLAGLANMECPGREGSAPVSSSAFLEETGRPIRWRVTGASRRGSSHVRSGLPNQDAFEYWASADGNTAVMAVADGHGSALCFRSEAGSHVAVTTAVELLRKFATTIRSGQSVCAIADRARAVLAEELTQSWRAAVAGDLAAKPFTPAEWASLAALEGWKGQQVVQRHPELAYGSTILAVVATTTYVLCMQLGDGDILFADSDGETRRALPKDDQVVPKQTASLWRRDAAAEFRVHVHEGPDDLPALIFAATDGYAESYESDREFLEIGRDYLRIIRNEGFGSVEHRLKGLLNAASCGRSGDDITVGLLSRLEQVQIPEFDLIENVSHSSVAGNANAVG